MRHLNFSSVHNLDCQLVVGKNSINSIPESIFIMDSGIRSYISSFPDAYQLNGGESVKSMDRVYEIYQLIRISKKDTLTGIGGGSILDLTGYSAITNSNIKKLYLVPTSPLAQVMPSISGNFSINFEFTKDLISTEGIPTKIFIDPSFSYKNYLDSGNSKLIPFVLIAHSFDMRLYNFLVNQIGNNTLIEESLWEDIIWSCINAYVEGLKNFQRVTGSELAKIIQSAFRLKINYELALAFGGIIEIWLGVNTGIIEKEDGKKLIGIINSMWGKSWPQKLDMSSITEFINELGKVSFWVGNNSKTSRGDISANDFVKFMRNEYGIRLESLM